MSEHDTRRAVGLKYNEGKAPEVIAKGHGDDNVSRMGVPAIFTVRDAYPGMSMAFPCKQRTAENLLRSFKIFGGPACRDPTVVVKSDTAKEITSAVRDLVWHSEPRLNTCVPAQYST